MSGVDTRFANIEHNDFYSIVFSAGTPDSKTGFIRDMLSFAGHGEEKALHALTEFMNFMHYLRNEQDTHGQLLSSDPNMASHLADMRKRFLAIYQIMCDAAEQANENNVFVRDTLKNTEFSETRLWALNENIDELSKMAEVLQSFISSIDPDNSRTFKTRNAAAAAQPPAEEKVYTTPKLIF